tara:strand:- start:389 stop:916 length:528 start_codon:yes stop_codon:yes gene_type:complete
MIFKYFKVIMRKRSRARGDSGAEWSGVDTAAIVSGALAPPPSHQTGATLTTTTAAAAAVDLRSDKRGRRRVAAATAAAAPQEEAAATALPTEDEMRERGIHDVVEALTMEMKTFCLQDLRGMRERSFGADSDHVKAKQKALRRAMLRGTPISAAPAAPVAAPVAAPMVTDAAAAP